MKARPKSPLRILSKLGGVVLYGAIGGILGSVFGFAVAIVIASISGFSNQQMLSFIPATAGVIGAAASSWGYLASKRGTA